jgi:hypothetical protein
MLRIPILIGALALALVAGGCGSSGTQTTTTAAAAAAQTTATVCPAAWKPGWQKLADEIHAPVYCPSWMPDPLDGRIGGSYANGRFVNPSRAYLVSFAWFEPSAAGVQEVHVNFRGYPGKAAIPICEDTLTVNGKTVHPKMPCFSDAKGTKRFGPITATVYTANQGADQWHVLYAWHRGGSLYTVSEHVAPPYTFKQVVANLDRVVRGLALLAPSS